MSEIWEICDQFTCKICFNQYSVTNLPLMVCRNSHLICKQCLKNMKENNRLPHICCPFCRARVYEQFAFQFKKILQVKEAALRILQRQKKEEEILKMIKQLSGHSNNSLIVEKLYDDLTLLDEKWKYVIDQYKSWQRQSSIILNRNFNIQIQKVAKLREQLSKISQLNIVLVKQAEQGKMFAQRNGLLAEQIKKLEEIIVQKSAETDKEEIKFYYNKLSKLPKLRICTEPLMKQAKSQISLRRDSKENNSHSGNTSQIIGKQANTKPRYQTMIKKTKSQYLPKGPIRKIEII